METRRGPGRSNRVGPQVALLPDPAPLLSPQAPTHAQHPPQAVQLPIPAHEASDPFQDTDFGDVISRRKVQTQEEKWREPFWRPKRNGRSSFTTWDESTSRETDDQVRLASLSMRYCVRPSRQVGGKAQEPVPLEAWAFPSIPPTRNGKNYGRRHNIYHV